MRVCLLSTAYPPKTTEGIARQRTTLAHALAHIGHEVHVVTSGEVNRSYQDGAVCVHEVAVRSDSNMTPIHPEINLPLSLSQALAEGLERTNKHTQFDVVDVPFWQAQGFVPLVRYRGPIVVWLQTTTAQLIRLHTLDRSNHLSLLGLEQLCLDRAAGLLADSRSVLDEVHRDYRVPNTALTGIAYLGLPPLDEHPPIRKQSSTVEALVVGRLEHRKGTGLLFQVLPALLQRLPQLRVRFIGRDNSTNDGWKRRTGLTYPEYFHQKYPQFADRVLFDGYVTEEKLGSCYQQADMLLAPSLYESFGLTYIEAMRSGLPVVALATGAACEIYPNGEQDGALLVPASDTNKLVLAIERVVLDKQLRHVMGSNGLARFTGSFTDEHMAEATTAFYHRIVEQSKQRRIYHSNHTPPLYQVMEALDIGDAVSNITQRNSKILASLGHSEKILARYHHPSLEDRVLPLHTALARPDTGIIFHYWGYNTSTWLLRAIRGPIALHYHNITPPHCYPPGSPAVEHAQRGYAQLTEIADIPDIIIGDSRYNVVEFMHYRSKPCITLPIYPVITREEQLAAAYDEALARKLRSTGEFNMLFVGRVARNKRQHLLMETFDYYWRKINRYAHLWIVGNDTSDPEYRIELESLRNKLPSGNRIHFTGKVRDEAMYSYFRSADVFVCASEHEGFCVPIAQAMALSVPVIAYDAAAVPETMGGTGFLVQQWDTTLVGELINVVLRDTQLRNRLIADQTASLTRFSVNEASIRLSAVVKYLYYGEVAPILEVMQPQFSEEQASHAAFATL